MQNGMSAAGSALKLGFFVSGLTIASLAARFATADVAPHAASRAEVKALAERLSGHGTDASLRQLFDSETNPLFSRFDVTAKRTPELAAIHGFEGAAPTLRMFDLPPASARAVNASLPFSLDINPPARPFVLAASTEDKEKALTCLTQAVYYEAGFEPGTGQQAVAQVVLNRMRHPIFPHSVCGVVYQGADLKTGCQFSFTCDGSLARKPQQAAWDRARIVAQQALNGYVMKEVGGATHYHTQWVVPWWQPTVSKVAQVGAHIFYRWQGNLGLPAAFAAHYAGNERMTATPNSPELLAAEAPKDVDGRVHMVITMADNTVQTPRERMQALAAKGALGAGFDPAAAANGTPAAPKSEHVVLAAADLQAPTALDLKVAAPRTEPAMQVRSANMNCMSSGCAHW